MREYRKKLKTNFESIFENFIERIIDIPDKGMYRFVKKSGKVSDFPLKNSNVFIKNRYSKRIAEFGFISFLSCFIFFSLFVFYISPTRGESMSPTIPNNSVVFGARLGTPWAPYPTRGEIWSNAVLGKGILAKRVVGMQGDYAEVNQDKKLVVAHSVIEGYPPIDQFFDDTIPFYINSSLQKDAEDKKVRFFMLGDNYRNSLDSRDLGTASLLTMGYKVYTIDEVKEIFKKKIENLNIF